LPAADSVGRLLVDSCMGRLPCLTDRSGDVTVGQVNQLQRLVAQAAGMSG
jgi:hypothetical protein